jgi:integrase
MMGKRGNGEGSITRHKKSGLYMARYWVETPTGPKRKTIYGKKREEVAEKLADALSDRNKGLVFDNENTTVGEYIITRWLEDSARGDLAPRTYSNYRLQARRHIVPVLGRKKLSKLSPTTQPPPLIRPRFARKR